jgi:hypothetical protein
MVIDRVQDGKIKDTRPIMDTLGMMMQLGVFPSAKPWCHRRLNMRWTGFHIHSFLLAKSALCRCGKLPERIPEKLSLCDDIAIVMFAYVFLVCSEKSKDQCVGLRLSEVRLIHHLNIEEPPSTPCYEFFSRMHENRARIKKRLKLFKIVLLA